MEEGIQNDKVKRKENIVVGIICPLHTIWYAFNVFIISNYVRMTILSSTTTYSWFSISHKQTILWACLVWKEKVVLYIRFSWTKKIKS